MNRKDCPICGLFGVWVVVLLSSVLAPVLFINVYGTQVPEHELASATTVGWFMYGFSWLLAVTYCVLNPAKNQRLRFIPIIMNVVVLLAMIGLKAFFQTFTGTESATWTPFDDVVLPQVTRAEKEIRSRDSKECRLLHEGSDDKTHRVADPVNKWCWYLSLCPLYDVDLRLQIDNKGLIGLSAISVAYSPRYSLFTRKPEERIASLAADVYCKYSPSQKTCQINARATSFDEDPESYTAQDGGFGIARVDYETVKESNDKAKLTIKSSAQVTAPAIKPEIKPEIEGTYNLACTSQM